MYEIDLFHDTDNTVAGYQGKRDIHMGVDIGGPVNTNLCMDFAIVKSCILDTTSPREITGIS